ncbi:MAG: M28 family peptidase [Candidatus Thorarchaeota archaeon]
MRWQTIGVMVTFTFLIASSIFYPASIASVDSQERVALAQDEQGLDLPEQIEEIFNAVSEQNFRAHVQYLSEDIGPRPIHTEANNETIDWLVDKLNEVSEGVLDVEVFGEWRSVVGRYIPEGGSNQVVLVGGHFDTVHVSPGADDNGSGIAYMLELARVLSKYEWNTQIWFVGFNNEEYGLGGSRDVALYIEHEGLDLMCALNADMILSNIRLPIYYFSDTANSFVWPACIQLLSELFGTDVVDPIDGWRFGGNSDHYYFHYFGYNATTAFDGTHMYWHTPDDTYDKEMYHYDVGAEFTAATAGAIALAIGFPEIFNADLDADTLVDIVEIVIGSDRNSADSDGDSLSDAIEYSIGTDFNSIDTDLDSLTDSAEVNIYHTNPLRADSDSDTMNDAYEIYFGLDPLVDDREGDLDGDGLLNIEEHEYGTFPNQMDSDNDNVSDFDEIMLYGSDPLNENSDGDFLRDDVDIFKNSPVDLPLFLGGAILVIVLLFALQRKR